MFKTDAKGKLEERARLYNNHGNPIKYYTTKNTVMRPRIHRRLPGLGKGTVVVNTKDLKDAFFNEEVMYAGKVARYYLELNQMKNSKNLIKNVGKVHMLGVWEKKHLVAFIRNIIKCKSKESEEIFNMMTKIQLMDLAFKLASA